MNDVESDILIAETEEEVLAEDVQPSSEYQSQIDDTNLFMPKEDVKEEENKTLTKETEAFVNYNFNNLNKVYKKYDVVKTYVPKKQEKQKQKQTTEFEKYVTEQSDYIPEKETFVIERKKEKQKFEFKPKAKAWLVSIIIIFAMLGGLAIYNAVNISNLNSQINQTTTSINNVNNDIKQVVKNIDELTDEDNVLQKAEELGLQEVAEENKVTIELIEKNEIEEYQSQTNFFDRICDFFRRLFGGWYLKHTIFTTYSMQKRLLVMVLLLISLFIFLFGRLFYLQVFEAKFLQERAEEQWTRDLPINAERGVIYDRNGIALAVSYTTYDVFVRHSNVEDEDAVAKLLSSKLGLDYQSVLSKVSNAKVSESLIKMQVESSVAKELKNSKLSGIYYSENTKRYYPYGDFLTQVLGYTTIDNIGQSGLELYYDKFLQGIDGYSKIQSDIRGTELYNTLDSYIPSVAGNNLTLTIDYQIQLLCEQAAVRIMQEQKPTSTQIIVMNPNTGEILAMTSKPSFDINSPPRDDVETLLAESKNLSIVDVYEPGSTFNILTTAAALEEKKTTLEDRFYDPGYRIVDGQKIKCWKHIGHGSQSMVDGLNNSCNSVFIDLALRLGLDKMYEYFEKFILYYNYVVFYYVINGFKRCQ